MTYSKEEQKEYNRKYYELNKEKISEYRELNKEKKAEYMSNYQKKNKDKVNEYQREYRKKHPEIKREADRRYHNKNKEANNERCRNYYQEHKEESRIYQKEYRRKRRIECKEYLGGKCVGCGTTERLEFDHIDRNLKEYDVGKRVSNSFAYLKPELDKCQLLCYDCHIVKSTINHDREKLAEGYRVSSVDNMGDKIIVILEKIT